MKICIILSTRPEIIKLASLIAILKKKKNKIFLGKHKPTLHKNNEQSFF